MKVIIPSYEPDDKLIKLIEDIKRHTKYDIIVINDGSSAIYSNIFAKAEQMGCTVLTHKKNLGKGSALKTAFKYVLTTDESEGVVCADSDGQHTYKDIKKIADESIYYKNTFVLGCREFSGNVPFRSMIGNKITSFVYFMLTNNKIQDTQTGLRSFSINMLPWLLNIDGERYEYEMNQLLELKESEYNIKCISIETIYENENKSSHFRPLYDSIRIYLPVIKFSLSSAICGLIDFILLFIMQYLTNNLLFSVVFSRIASSIENFLINKNVVFKNKSQNNNIYLIKYYLLVLFILMCNYLLLNLFTRAGMNILAGKILTELILFLISFIAQRRFIFTCKTVH